jgi:hypothetical protein
LKPFGAVYYEVPAVSAGRRKNLRLLMIFILAWLPVCFSSIAAGYRHHADKVLAGFFGRTDSVGR